MVKPKLKKEIANLSKGTKVSKTATANNILPIEQWAELNLSKDFIRDIKNHISVYVENNQDADDLYRCFLISTRTEMASNKAVDSGKLILFHEQLTT